MIATIHQPQYLPYLGFFHKVRHSDLLVMLDDVQFSKSDVQNRNKIKTRDGWQWITVPVLQRLGQLISEVEIDPRTPWQRKHWNALSASYGRAPHFRALGPALKDRLDQDWTKLGELNVELTRWAMESLGIVRPMVFSSSLDVEGTQTERLVNICRAVGADAYLSGPGGRSYLELPLFEAAGIDVLWQEFTHPVYEQVQPEAGFIPNLSVVDALFACGPGVVSLLE
jgi:hypothetical protein